MPDLQRNPYPIYEYPPSPNSNYNHPPIVGWKWFDESGEPCDRTFATQAEALKDLMAYMHFLEHGPTLWQRVWWPIRYTLWPKVMEFIHS